MFILSKLNLVIHPLTPPHTHILQHNGTIHKLYENNLQHTTVDMV